MAILLLRTIILYAVIVAALRIMGKRQLGELQPSELVVTILVSNIATISIEDTSVPLLGSILPIFMLVFCEVMMSVVILKSVRARKIVSGNPRIIIRDGAIDQKEMRNLRWSIDDLMAQLRTNNIFNINDVSLAIVETSGSLSAYQKYHAQTATIQALDLPLPPNPDAPCMTIISDGKIVDDALNYCQVDQRWLQSTLKKQKLQVQDIFLMTCDRNRCYNITLYEGGTQKK